MAEADAYAYYAKVIAEDRMPNLEAATSEASLIGHDNQEIWNVTADLEKRCLIQPNLALED